MAIEIIRETAPINSRIQTSKRRESRVNVVLWDLILYVKERLHKQSTYTQQRVSMLQCRVFLWDLVI